MKSFSLSACLSISILAIDAIGQDVLDIEKRWEARARTFESALINLVVDEFLPEGSLARRFPGFVAEGIPKQDSRISHEGRFVISGSKLRWEHKGQRYSEPLKDFFPNHEINIFDGKNGYRITSASQTDGFSNRGYIDDNNRAAASGDIDPLLIRFRPQSSSLSGFAENYTFERKTSDGELVFTNYLENIFRYSLIIRSSGDHDVVGIQVFGPNSKLLWDTKIRYNDKTPSELIGWSRARYDPDGGLLSEKTYLVSSTMINLAVPESEFILDFPNNTLVKDRRIFVPWFSGKWDFRKQ